MTESDNGKESPNSQEERALRKQERIAELGEKLREQSAEHLHLLEEKGYGEDPRKLLGSHVDRDIRSSREELWHTQTELLGLDPDALTPRDPENP
jgi:hypothetical protein